MELFKKKKKDEDAEERQEVLKIQAVTEEDAEGAAESESFEAAEAPPAQEVAKEAKEAKEDEALILPEAARIVEKTGRPELEESLRDVLNGLREGIESGHVSEETAQLLALGLDYERAVKEADAAGEIRGRNAAIEEKLLTRNDSDGIPHPGCGQGGASAQHSFSIFDLARNAR